MDERIVKKRSRQMRQQGFTLIELMIVVLILGILATIAVPTYQDRVMRAQVAEAIELGDFARTAVEGYRKKYGKVPSDNAAAGLPEAEKIVGNYVMGVSIQQGAIQIRMGNRVHKALEGKVLSIRPAVVSDEPLVPIAWICGNASVPNGMEVVGTNETSLRREQLPLDCRS